ncbi:MAG: glycosyltransferase [Planctomycetes bacterium]|nr:glycosyltransferase [Planctomycetota bacterium]
MPTSRLLLGAVGRLSSEKGFDLLIQAVHALVQQGHDLELWIAGEGDQRPNLEKLIEDLGAGDYIKLQGFCQDPIEFYHALDLYVLSSHHEGLPNVVLEAMAMRVPVVATRVVEVPGLLIDGRTGVLCEPGDLDSLTVAILRAVQNPALREELTCNARLLIEERFSFRGRMSQEKAIYDRLLKRDGATTSLDSRAATV